VLPHHKTCASACDFGTDERDRPGESSTFVNKYMHERENRPCRRQRPFWPVCCLRLWSPITPGSFTLARKAIITWSGHAQKRVLTRSRREAPIACLPRRLIMCVHCTGIKHAAVYVFNRARGTWSIRKVYTRKKFPLSCENLVPVLARVYYTYIHVLQNMYVVRTVRLVPWPVARFFTGKDGTTSEWYCRVPRSSTWKLKPAFITNLAWMWPYDFLGLWLLYLPINWS
jgi:hypothetical protein